MMTDDKRRDPKVENKLDQQHYTRTGVEDVDVNLIDYRGSLDNPARFGKKLDIVYVETMINTLETGTVPLPAIVLVLNDQVGLFRYSVASGMHRLTAYRACKRDTIPAYIVTEPDPERRFILPGMLNSIEGQRNTRDERYAVIYSAVKRSRSADVKSLCAAFGVKLRGYKQYEKGQSALERFVKFGFREGQAPLDVITMLSEIPVQINAVYISACEYVSEYRVKIDSVRALVDKINETEGLDECLEIIRRDRAKAIKPRSAGGTTTRKSPLELRRDYARLYINLYRNNGMETIADFTPQDKLLNDELIGVIREQNREMERRNNILKKA